LSDPLHPIPIQELKALGEVHHWQIEQTIAGLDTLTPVRGQLTVEHRGTVLAVKGQAATIVTLCCDRCLKHFNHALQASADETIWLGEASPAAAGEKEAMQTEHQLLALDSDACDLLNPRGSFDPEHWVFEQLSLQLPFVNHCGSECPGPPTWSSDGRSGDPRWAALGQLKP
jgi:uncharacterized protein